MQIASGRIPSVLFIKGVFKKDCISDDFFEKKILETITPYPEVVDQTTEIVDFTNMGNLSYDKLPSIFSNIDMWPKKTNLLCWYCTLGFTYIPVFIPKVIEPVSIKKNFNIVSVGDSILDECNSSKKYSISVHGTFCTFGCAQAFIDKSEYSIPDKIEYTNKLKFLYKLFYNKKFNLIPGYPEPYEMKQFGGTYTIDQYREFINKLNSQ